MILRKYSFIAQSFEKTFFPWIEIVENITPILAAILWIIYFLTALPQTRTQRLVKSLLMLLISLVLIKVLRNLSCSLSAKPRFILELPRAKKGHNI